MSWNFETANFSVRLPVVDQDGPQLFELLKNQNAAAHIPRLAQTVDAQAFRLARSGILVGRRSF